ncbi:response regulator [Pseudoroseomonas wenyumeiae]|uniref:Response regulator n=1 Tax=Teichococcus wenyumeiae TaxID=2478470 RepID=A0A3A9J8Y8_9PROT|nr:response regulator [Pseudoroseomonas wenyumeiae]RKK02892.1 response regulator [Pseudoroseomonas wenyumeiae]RMI24667.1 response regulator [Pseudoroseomonas wenyumeiae]
MDPRMTLNGRRILVVEDEALIAMLVEDALLDAGAEVLGPAATVEEALALLEDSEIGGAVLDINLAGQLSTPVADLLAERGVPFVVATGYGAAGLPEHHRGVPVLAKPYDPRELVETLEQICG